MLHDNIPSENVDELKSFLAIKINYNELVDTKGDEDDCSSKDIKFWGGDKLVS